MDSTKTTPQPEPGVPSFDAWSDEDFARLVEVMQPIVRSAAIKFVEDRYLVEDIAQQLAYELLERRRQKQRKPERVEKPRGANRRGEKSHGV